MEKNNGFTLIEVVFASAIFALTGISIISLYQTSLRIISENKAREDAIALTNQEMELIRNLSYDDIGVLGGVVPGNLLQEESVVRNNRVFTVNRSVLYVDDPFDGTAGGSPDDTVSNDYKKVTIASTWQTSRGANTYSLITNIAPKGVETTLSGGTLRVTVIDASGTPIQNADVHIENNSVVPTIDTTLQTNSSGVVNIPGLDASDETYEITVSKSGYSSDYTCGVDPLGNDCTDSEGNPEPTNPHASVLEGELTSKTFVIDLVSTITVKTVSQALPSTWRVNTDTTSFDQDNASITICPNGNYIFSWRDKRQSGNPRIYAQQYDVNGNAQWSPDLAITASNNQNYPDIAADASCNIYVIWSDDRNGNQDAYFDKYNSSGTEMLGGNNKLDTQSNNDDQTIPQIIINASSTYEYIVWQDNRTDESDIYVQKIDPNGTSIWANEVKVNSDSSGNAQYVPKIGTDHIIVDNIYNIYFVWHDNRNSGSNDIYLQKIDNSGVKQYGSDVQINTDPSATEQSYPAFSVGNDNYLYVVWQDNRDGNYDIYLQKYDLNGTKIYSNDVRVDLAPDSTSQQLPAIVYNPNDSYLYVVWQDDRNGNWDIYGQKVDPSDGSAQWTADIRVNSITTNDQQNPDILISSSGYPVIAWQDNSGGDFDIVVGQFTENISDPIPFPNVPIIVSGSKQLGNNPVLLKYTDSGVSDSLGILTFSNIEWDSYNFTTSTALTIQKTEPPMPLNVLPNSSAVISIFITSP